MGDQMICVGPGLIPHHGPVSPECPVECLLTVLSRTSFNPLARAYDAPFDPPRTVGDVMNLHAHRQLRKISGLGQRRVSEIEAALIFAGLDLGEHRQRLAGMEGHGR